MISIAGNRH